MRDLADFKLFGISAREGDPAAEREKLNLSREEVQGPFLNEFNRLSVFYPEAAFVYLGTCHRIELYTYGLPRDVVLAMWRKLKPQAPIKSLHEKSGLTAFTHLLRVGASLESEVVGETQITGQLRSAFDGARQVSSVRGPLLQIFQQALRAIKNIRSASELGRGTVSVAHSAIDGLEDVFDTFLGKRALVVGAGSMALQALDRLRQHGVEDITWINRSKEKIAAHPTSQIAKIGDFSQLSKLVWEHQISVFATSSPQQLLAVQDLQACVQLGRRGQLESPRILLDLGLPRNVDERCHNKLGFFVRNVDEFSNRSAEGMSERRRAVEVAEGQVRTELDTFIKLWDYWEKGPLISEVVKHFARFKEVELSLYDLENNPEIEYKVSKIFAKLLHRLLRSLETLKEPEAAVVLESLARAWRHSDQWQEESPLLQKLQSDLRIELEQQKVRPLQKA